MTIERVLYEISVWVLPILFAITLHEAAHGWVAHRLGDDTAYRLGRVTMNPLRHIDPFGTVILPAMLLLISSQFGARFALGYAKPVPVAFGRLRHPRRDMVWVAAAGPVSNLLMALTAAATLHVAPLFPDLFGTWLADNLANAILINVLLAVFNMIPMPPLDGGRVAVGLLPMPLAIRLAKLERAGFAIILGVVFILPYLGAQVGVDLNVFRWLVLVPTEFVSTLILRLVGL